MSETMSRELAAITIRDYVCSTCWGQLIEIDERQQSRVECAAYGSEHAGFVTKYYAEHRRSDSIAENWEVRDTLTQIGVIENPHKGKTPEQLLSELGF